jgi:hypothetical protein
MIIDTWKSPYSIKCDGRRDNATGLMKLREALAISDEHHTINFRSGIMLSSFNKWLVGIRSFEVVGNGTVFKSLYIGSDEAFHRSVFVGEMFQNNVLGYKGTKEYETADRFMEAMAGASEVALITNKGNYAAGDRILLYSGNYAPDGYPPPAAAEWRTVIKVEGSILHLDMPITKNYLESQWDNPVISGGGCGKPRVINLDRNENRYCDYARFTGITFANSTDGVDGNFTFPAMRLELRRCKIEGFFWPSEARTVIVEDTVINKTEFDKLVESVECTRVRFAGSANGGGSIDKIVLTDCQAASGIRFDPRHLWLKNIHIRQAPDPAVNVDEWISSVDTYPAKNPIRSVSIQNLTLSSSPDAKADCHISKFSHSKLEIVVVTNNGEIVTRDFNLVKTMEIGTTVLSKDDGTNGGLVTDIYYDSIGFIIRGTWKKPEPGETWIWSYVKNVIDLGGHRILDGKRLYDGNSIRWKGNICESHLKEMHLTEADFIWRKGQNSNIQFALYGHFVSVEFYLTKPAPGMKMNIQAAGKTLVQSDLSGANMCSSQIAFPTWVGMGYLNTYDITSEVTPDQLPRFSLIIKWMEFQ